MIIDFRLRPAFDNYTGSFLFDFQDKVKFAPKFGTDIPLSVQQKSVEICLLEMDEVGVNIGLVPARKCFDVTNDALESFLKQYPGRFWGLAALDPDDPQKALEEIERYVIEGSCVGVSVEPGLTKIPQKCNSPQMEVIYQKCEELNIPILLSFGGLCYPRLDDFQPTMLDNVAKDFPKLNIVLAHGGYPWITEVSWIALSCENVYLSPDIYGMHAPGAYNYIQAANYFLQEQVIFASAYPSVSLKSAVDFYQNCGLDVNILPKFMYLNALKALNMENFI